MRNVENLVSSKKDLAAINRKNFKLSMIDNDFANLAYKLDLSEDTLMKYTSKLEHTVCELKNCKNCKGLKFCKNEVKGYVNFPSKKDEVLIFSYTPCRFKKEYDKYKSNTVFYEMPTSLMNARMKDIYVDDNARVELLKYI